MKLRMAKKVLKNEAQHKMVYRASTFARALRRVPYSFYAKQFKIFLGLIQHNETLEYRTTFNAMKRTGAPENPPQWETVFRP